MKQSLRDAERLLKGWRGDRLFPQITRDAIARALRETPRSQRRYIRFQLEMISEFPPKPRRRIASMPRKKSESIAGVKSRIDELLNPTGLTQLEQLLERYVEARIADHEKGGGDPADWPEIEHELIVARADLREYLMLITRHAIVELNEQDFRTEQGKKLRVLMEDLKRFPQGTL